MKFTITKLAAAFVFTAVYNGSMAAPVSTYGCLCMRDPSLNLITTDNTISGFVDQSGGTWGVTSSQPFYGLPWTASGGILYTAPGNYSISKRSLDAAQRNPG